MRESVQAEVLMSFIVSEELSFRIPVELGYETKDPFAVRMTFHLPGVECVQSHGHVPLTQELEVRAVVGGALGLEFVKPECLHRPFAPASVRSRLPRSDT